jgi:hypothetical protein
MILSNLILTASIFTPLALAQTPGSIQINIYNGDNDYCTEGYEASFYPFVNDDCYNFSWEGSTANGLVDCTDTTKNTFCECTFYSAPDCNSDYNYVGTVINGCIQGNWQSFQCHYQEIVPL